MKTFSLQSAPIWALFFIISHLEAVPLSTSEEVKSPERFSRAIVTQFNSFKKEHPIQAKILALVSDLLLRPSSVHSLLKNSGEKGGSGPIAQAEERVMRSQDETGEDILLPQASSYRPTSYSYANVRRSGRFMFPDEYEDKVKRFEAEQERSLGRSNYNNYHIVNNQVRLGRVESVKKPDVHVGVPFIPRGRGGRKFEPSVVDASISTGVYSNLSDKIDGDQDRFLAPTPTISTTLNKNVGNEFENWKKFGILPQEQPVQKPKAFSIEASPELRSSSDDNDHTNKPSSEWTAVDMFTKPRNDEISSQMQFRRPISVQRDAIPVLRPIFNTNTQKEFGLLHSNRIARQGKSLGFDVGSQESEWQLLSTSGQKERFSPSTSMPTSAVGVGSVQIAPASSFASSDGKEETASPNQPVELPRVSKVMRPSTIRSQPLIVKDARDGRSLKEIEVQGVKIIVGSKTLDFPKDIYMRNNYVRSLAPSVDKSSVDINVGSSITTL